MPSEQANEQLAVVDHGASAMTPMAMIQTAFQKALESGGADALAVADRLLVQIAKQRDYEDREAFNAALRRIQDELKPIVKRGENAQTHSTYAEAEDIDNAIDGLLSRERMTLSFEPRSSDKENEIVIVGILSLGAYSKEYPLPIPVDGKGPKGDGVMSRVHAVGSGVTYGKRYIKNMIFNLRFKEPDDDGNAASGKGMKGLKECLEDLKNAKTLAEAKTIWRNGSIAAKEAKDYAALGKITAEFGEANVRLGGGQ